MFRNAEDEVFALLDRCPHKGGPLSQGIVFGDQRRLPAAQLDDRPGRRLREAPDEGCTPRFSVKVEDGQVLLDATELATLALDLLPPRCRAGVHGRPHGDESFDVQAPHREPAATKHAPPARTAASAAA